jgi:hypothetical protein
MAARPTVVFVGGGDDDDVLHGVYQRVRWLLFYRIEFYTLVEDVPLL